MPLAIPVQPGDLVGSVDYSFDFRLEGRDLTFDLHFNSRDGRWYLSLSDGGEPIVTGVKIVLGALLGRRSAHPLFRLGGLVAVDLEAPAPGAGAEASFADLGRRVSLRWYTAEELAALAGYA